MSGIAIAVLSIGGSIIVALLTWLLNLVSELQKTIIHKDQVRFASFHSKQVEILTSIYPYLSKMKRSANSMIFKLPKEKIPINPHWINSYANATSEAYKQLIQDYEEFKIYAEDNGIYIPETLEGSLYSFTGSVVKFLNIHKDYVTVDDASFQDNAERLYNINLELRKLAEEIRDTRKLIRNAVRQIMSE